MNPTSKFGRQERIKGRQGRCHKRSSIHKVEKSQRATVRALQKFQNTERDLHLKNVFRGQVFAVHDPAPAATNVNLFQFPRNMLYNRIRIRVILYVLIRSIEDRCRPPMEYTTCHGLKGVGEGVLKTRSTGHDRLTRDLNL
jgi:hypothetical protein